MSLDLGVLIAHLGLDASGVVAGAGVAKTALRETEVAGVRTGKSFEEMKKRLVAGLAIGSVFEFGKASVEAFSKAEQAQLKLTTAFDRFPKLANSSSEAMSKLAEATSLKTKFDKASTIAAEASLAQFGLTGKQIEQTIPLVQDYAARTGRDLPEAAKLLGKSFLGQTRALKDVGIRYKSTGDQALDFANITKLLGEKVGGFAEKQGQTAAGRLAILGNKFEELKVKVGGALIPALQGLGNVFSGVLDVVAPIGAGIAGVVQAFGNLPGPIKAVAIGLGAFALLRMVDVFGGIASAAVTLGGTLVKAGAAMYAALGPIGIALGVVTAAFAVFSTLMQNDVKKATEDQKKRLDDLTGTLDANTGAVNKNTREAVVKAAQDAGVLATMEKLGISTKDYTDAVLGSVPAQKRFASSVADQEKALLGAGGSFKDLQGAIQGAGITQKELTDALISGNWDTVTGKVNAYGEAVSRQTGNADAGVPIQDAFTAALTATTDPMQKLDGLSNKVAEQTDAISEKQKAATERAKALGAATADTTKNLVAFGQSVPVTALQALHDIAPLTAQGILNVDTELLKLSEHTASTDQAADFTNMQASLKKVSDAASTADAQLQFFTQDVNKLAGINVDASATQKLLNDTLRGAEQGFKDAQANLKTLNDALLKTPAQLINSAAEFKRTGVAINTTTEAGSKLSDSLTPFAQAYDKATSAAYSNAVAAGHSKDALKGAQAAADGARDKFITMATAALGSRAAAIQLADELGILEGKKLHDKDFGVSAKTKAANAAVDALNAKVLKDKQAAAAYATKKAADALATLNRTVLATKKAKTEFDTKQSLASLAYLNRAKLLGKLSSLTANNSPFLRSLSVANRAALKDKLAKMFGDAAPYFTKLSAANQAKFLDKLAKINGDNSDANAKIKATQTAIDALTGKTIPITYTGTTGPSRAGGGISGSFRMARGGRLNGPGTGTSDSIPVDASHGEFIVNARATKKHLPLIEAINNDVPAFAAGGLVSNVNMRGSSLNAPNFAKMLDTAAGMMAASMAEKFKAMVPPMPAVTSGVAQWIPMMKRVIAAKGFSMSVLPVMTKQMEMESSGNPRAINLTDINAQRGHPSVGLLQFIPSTFARYADPGYNRNIWDPESQMRAFLNYVPARYGNRGSFSYLTRIGNTAYAKGGLLKGPGTGTSDSIRVLDASDGEYITNARATAKHLPLLEAINRDVPAYAAGGLVSTSALAGLSPQQPGARESLVIDGFTGLTAAIQGLRDAAIAASEQYRTAAGALGDAQGEAIKTAAQGRADVAAARKDLQVTQVDQARNVAKTKLDAARSIVDAQLKRHDTLQQIREELATTSNRSKTLRDYAAADRATMIDLQRAQEDARLSTQDAVLQQRRETEAAAGKLRAVQAAATADNQSAAAKVSAANRVRQTELQLAKATDARARRAEALQRAESRLAGTQTRLGQRFDLLTGQLGDARDKLAGLRGDRSSKAAGLAGNIGNYDSGILGQPDTRRTPADIIRGLTFDLSKVSRFTNNLNELKKKGLSGGLLDQIASAGVDGGDVTATALRKASSADIARINELQRKTEQWANVGGSLVAGATFDPLIASQGALVTKLATYTAQVDGAMRAIAGALNAMDVKLVIDPQGIARLVNKGNVLLGRR